MADQLAQFETQDNAGSSEVFGGAGGTSLGTITTTPQNVPSVADKVISSYIVVTDGIGGRELLVSDDGGTTFFAVPKKSSLEWDAKGFVTQIQIKSDSSTIDGADVQIKINFEE